jgi:hypothetical protein
MAVIAEYQERRVRESVTYRSDHAVHYRVAFRYGSRVFRHAWVVWIVGVTETPEEVLDAIEG